MSVAIRKLRPRSQEMEVESSNLILQRHIYMLASYEMLYSTREQHTHTSQSLRDCDGM